MTSDKDKRIAELEREIKELRWLFNALRDEFFHLLESLKK